VIEEIILPSGTTWDHKIIIPERRNKIGKRERSLFI
jgi:hypothetical protein